ncbi:hypothetical protein Mal15_46170 [Stieleria maiorica]|uniref:Secreted protein n=1 Tax=Stieleria maiorica TaxID=2795974 RepID=A0A5B9MKM1_9BACT|nr:hypothetical protein [Stieleria maiorica]QEG00547.1 hypothetical protein Mal15_46170 [Stieleria maiorica]
MNPAASTIFNLLIVVRAALLPSAATKESVAAVNVLFVAIVDPRPATTGLSRQHSYLPGMIPGNAGH